MSVRVEVGCEVGVGLLLLQPGLRRGAGFAVVCVQDGLEVQARGKPNAQALEAEGRRLAVEAQHLAYERLQVAQGTEGRLVGKGGQALQPLTAIGAVLVLPSAHTPGPERGTCWLIAPRPAMAGASQWLHARLKELGEGGAGGRDGRDGRDGGSSGSKADVGPEAIACRRRADVAGKEMARAFEGAKRAHEAGKGGEAKRLADEGHAAKARMLLENRNAAAATFAALNAESLARGEVDLHGLRVEEALRIVEHVLQVFRKAGRSSAVVVVGKGLHSEQGIARIGPQVEALLSRMGLQATRLPGSLRVQL